MYSWVAGVITRAFGCAKCSDSRLRPRRRSTRVFCLYMPINFSNVNLSAAAPEHSGVLTAAIVVFVRGGARLGSSACAWPALPMGVGGVDVGDALQSRRGG